MATPELTPPEPTPPELPPPELPPPELPPPTSSFGDRVKAQRKAQRLSQQELAKRVGISRNYLSEIERGESTNLSWQVRDKLASVLGLVPSSQPTPQGDLPPGLAEFADAAKLPPGDIQMLAGLQYRGQQPTTADKWELLYNVIKMTVGK